MSKKQSYFSIDSRLKNSKIVLFTPNHISTDDGTQTTFTMIKENGKKSKLRKVSIMPKEGEYDKADFSSFMHNIKTYFYYLTDNNEWVCARDYQIDSINEFYYYLLPLFNVPPNNWSERALYPNNVNCYPLLNEKVKEFKYPNNIIFSLVFEY